MKRKFNIVDVIIILLIVIALIVAGFVYFKISNTEGKEKNEVKDTIKLHFAIEVNNLTENMTKVYKEGQKIVFNDYGDCEGKIKKVEVLPYKVWTRNTEIGEVLITEVPDKYTVKLTIETDVVKENNMYSCENERITIGKPLLFKIKGATLGTCYIVDLYEVE